MKKLIIIVAILVVSLPISAQFQGFFKPLEKNPVFLRELTADRTNNIFLIRMGGGFSAVETVYNWEEKKFSQNAFSQIGFGLSLNHYTPNIDGSVYNNWGINGFIFANNEKISLALTASAWQYFQVGFRYTPGVKEIGFFSGLKYNF